MVHEMLLQHGADLAHAHLTAEMTSFIKVPGLLRDAAAWISDHIPGQEAVAAAAAVPSGKRTAAVKGSDDVQRVVDYYAKDCPHSQALAPIWNGAADDWNAGQHEAKLVWEQKECYGSDWKPGKDFEECQRESVESFPTIKYYYGKKDQYGEEILVHDDKDRLLDVMSSRADPEAWDRKTAAFGLTPEQEEAGLSAPWDVQPATHFGGGRVVDYFAKECSHCQHLEPVWKSAHKMWLDSHPGKEADVVKWEQKECFGDRWEPGKDYDECVAQGVHSFPTVRFHGNSGDYSEDMLADRSAKNLLQFVNERSQPPEGTDAQQQADAAPIAEENHEIVVPSKASARKAAAAAVEHKAAAASAKVDEHQAPSAAKPKAAQGEVAAAAAAATDTETSAAGLGPPRLVEYMAKDCPHCQTLEPVWKDIQDKWASTGDTSVVFEQKECLGSGWKQGKDFAECQKADIKGFPTIRMYGASSSPSVEYHGKRTTPAILDFVLDNLPGSKPGAKAGMKAVAAEASKLSGKETLKVPAQAAVAPSLLAALYCAPARGRGKSQQVSALARCGGFL
eukprot:gb/GFBE01040592.1/.p1 GENE.gb/GFBE01040592.1/~~gb/GFBE01040592.1/.p1  ORF type:complete len:563 (+),score=141.82 gb/GFBE01040592.1/:1-1689(+)